MDFIQFRQCEAGYPATISKYLGNNSPEIITALVGFVGFYLM
jgi:hypothetical protein